MNVQPVKVPCQWFVMCDEPADGVLAHPLFGYLPCCARCARVVGEQLTPADFITVDQYELWRLGQLEDVKAQGGALLWVVDQ